MLDSLIVTAILWLDGAGGLYCGAVGWLLWWLGWSAEASWLCFFEWTFQIQMGGLEAVYWDCFTLATDVECKGLWARLDDFVRTFIRSFEGWKVCIPTNNNKLCVLQAMRDVGGDRAMCDVGTRARVRTLSRSWQSCGSAFECPLAVSSTKSRELWVRHHIPFLLKNITGLPWALL